MITIDQSAAAIKVREAALALNQAAHRAADLGLTVEILVQMERWHNTLQVPHVFAAVKKVEVIDG